MNSKFPLFFRVFGNVDTAAPLTRYFLEKGRFVAVKIAILGPFLVFVIGILVEVISASERETIKIIRVNILYVRQDKNDRTKDSASFAITALFTYLYDEGKSAAISESADIWIHSKCHMKTKTRNLF